MKESLLTYKYMLKLITEALYEIKCPAVSLLLMNTFKKINIVKEDKNFSMAISSREELSVGLDFWCNKLETESDAKTVFLHELMHHILGDTKRLKNLKAGELPIANIAMDMRINAWITFSKTQAGINNDNFFEKFYSSKSVPEALLRSNSILKSKNAQFLGIYNQVWQQHIYEYDNIYNTLKILLANKGNKLNIQILGSHEPQNGKIKELDSVFVENLMEALKEDLKKSSDGYSLYGTPNSQIIDIIDQASKLSRRLLSSFSITQNFNSIKSLFPVARKTRTVLPISPTKRDLFKVATGNPPIFWTGSRTVNNYTKKGIAIYLDVSGSTMQYLPRILGLISRLDSGIQTIFEFSTIVNSAKISDLRNGIINTTGGTDFNSVAEHIVKNKFQKCLMFTDAAGYLGDQYFTPLKETLKECAIILFEKTDRQYARNLWFCKNYKTYILEEVVN